VAGHASFSGSSPVPSGTGAKIAERKSQGAVPNNMAIIRRDEDGDLVVMGRKHPGELLDDVAAADPDYVQWIYRNATEDLPQDVFHALQDVMEKNGIEQ
jgi:hypothetical protein